MRDHLGCGDRPQAGALGQAVVAGVAVQESGSEQIAGTRGVEHLLDRLGRRTEHTVGGDHQTAVGTHRDDRQAAVALHLADGPVEAVDLVQRHEFVLVAEQDVDLVGHERTEVVAVPVDAERIAEGEADLTLMGVRHPRRVPERFFRLGPVVEVALHVQHLARSDGCFVDVAGAQQRRHTEVGVHRAFGVGGDDDDAPAGGGVAVGLAGTELHAHRTQVVAEHPAEIVVAHLADVGRSPAEAGDADDRVGGRATAHLDGTAQCPIEVHRPVGVDQGHRPLHEFVVAEEPVVGVGDDVDQSVADTHHVELQRHVGHG